MILLFSKISIFIFPVGLFVSAVTVSPTVVTQMIENRRMIFFSAILKDVTEIPLTFTDFF